MKTKNKLEGMIEGLKSPLMNKKGEITVGTLSLITFGIGAVFGATVSTLITLPLNKNPEYVNPRRAIYLVEDINQNKRNETTIEYKGQKYLMKYNEKANRINLVPYHVEVNNNIVTDTGLV